MTDCRCFYLLVFYFLLLQSGQCRRGSTGARGSSSSRTGIIGSNSGVNQPKGGSHSSSIGSPSLSTGRLFKTAIASKLAGYFIYQAGKKIISSALSPMMLNGRAYYWDVINYVHSYGMQICSMPIESADAILGNIFFKDGTRPKQIVWGCLASRELCCEYECCQSDGVRGLVSNDATNLDKVLDKNITQSSSNVSTISALNGYADGDTGSVGSNKTTSTANYHGSTNITIGSNQDSLNGFPFTTLVIISFRYT